MNYHDLSITRTRQVSGQCTVRVAGLIVFTTITVGGVLEERSEPSRALQSAHRAQLSAPKPAHSLGWWQAQPVPH